MSVSAGEQLIYGVHAVKAALKYDPGNIVEAWVEQHRHDRRIQPLVAHMEGLPLRLHRVPRRELDRLAEGEVHQGIIARYRGQPILGEADLQGRLDELREEPFLLVLDQIQDPHNLGACLRIADAAGMHGVIAPRDRAVGLTPTVHKVASGAAQSVPFFQVTNLARTLRSLKDRGVWLAGAAGEAERSVFEANLAGPLAIAMGAEDTGLRRLTRELCDFLVRIPMHGTVDSLNASVATGVIAFEALRQRNICRT